jgi:hypothetical protein
MSTLAKLQTELDGLAELAKARQRAAVSPEEIGRLALADQLQQALDHHCGFLELPPLTQGILLYLDTRHDLDDNMLQAATILATDCERVYSLKHPGAHEFLSTLQERLSTPTEDSAAYLALVKKTYGIRKDGRRRSPKQWLAVCESAWAKRLRERAAVAPPAPAPEPPVQIRPSSAKRPPGPPVSIQELVGRDAVGDPIYRNRIP